MTGNGQVRFGGRPCGKGPAKKRAPRRAADPPARTSTLTGRGAVWWPSVRDGEIGPAPGHPGVPGVRGRRPRPPEAWIRVQGRRPWPPEALFLRLRVGLAATRPGGTGAVALVRVRGPEALAAGGDRGSGACAPAAGGRCGSDSRKPRAASASSSAVSAWSSPCSPGGRSLVGWCRAFSCVPVGSPGVPPAALARGGAPGGAARQGRLKAARPRQALAGAVQGCSRQSLQSAVRKEDRRRQLGCAGSGRRLHRCPPTARAASGHATRVRRPVAAIAGNRLGGGDPEASGSNLRCHLYPASGTARCDRSRSRACWSG